MLFTVTRRRLPALALAAAFLAAASAPLQAQVTAFRQAVAETAHGDEAVAAFYRLRDYEPIFTGEADSRRRGALLRALDRADAHGLPSARYDVFQLRAALAEARSPRDRGRAEALAAKMFVQYAQDIQTGALTPQQIDSGIVREPVRRDRLAQLQAFAGAEPERYIDALAPRTVQYNALLAEKIRLETAIGKGGWGPTVAAGALGPGQQGADVVALRNRLIAMGYMKRTASGSYDGPLQKAVQKFQLNHGLTPDGVAGEATLDALNVAPEARLASVIVAMERERWSGAEPKGRRHVLVNIPEFTAYIVDEGKTSFSTRVVVGKNQAGQRTPEFSDTMKFMVVNPTWNVPRSITTKEYLPMLKRNPNAVGHLRLTDSKGRVINRSSVNFAKYSARNFPYRLKQPPSKSNALGEVKFMFPNKYNIYLHDTPSKSLFDRDRRAFSHGCVRLADPKDFAYALLSRQTDDPQGLFQARLKTGAESRINLEQPVPIHLVYRTAFALPRAGMNYREDIYGRDGKIWEALREAGVKLPAAGS